MGHELKSFIQLDTRKLIWLIGITFVVIITFQYLELPYGNVLSTLFPSGKISVEEQSSFLASGPSSAESGLDYNGTYAGNERAHDNEISEGKNTDLNNDVISETDVGLNKSSTFDEGSKPPKESSTEEFEDLNKNSTADYAESSNNKTVAEEASKTEESFSSKNDTVDINTSNNSIGNENVTSSPVSTVSSDTSLGSPLPALPPTTNITLEKDVETNIRTPVVSVNSSISPVEQHVTPSFDKNEKSEEIQNDFTTSGDNSSPPNAPKMKKKPEMPPALTTIADMNNLFYQSRVSYYSMVCSNIFFHCY